MAFTDDDLERLKDSVSGRHTDDWISLDPVSVDALLTRLEAAEGCAWYAGDYDPEFLRNPLWKAWRKAAGKELGGNGKMIPRAQDVAREIMKSIIGRVFIPEEVEKMIAAELEKYAEERVKEDRKHRPLLHPSNVGICGQCRAEALEEAIGIVRDEPCVATHLVSKPCTICRLERKIRALKDKR